MLLAGISFGLSTPFSAPKSAKRAIDRTAIAKQHFGNDTPWYQDRIPYFDSSDGDMNDVYYYRWKVFRAHQRDLGDRGFVSTEFLDDVSWQLQPWATLNDATGFHLGEGRWLRDRRYKDDYLDLMFSGHANDRHFSDYMADAAWQCYLVDNDFESGTRYIEELKALYNEWDDHRDESKVLYWIEPLYDATEYTISSIDASGGQDGFNGGQAFRPSINSYMYANFKAIAKMVQLAGNNKSVVDEYNARAEVIKDRVQMNLWNATLEHFVDRYYIDNEFVDYWSPIQGRELVGILPWMFDMVDDTSEYAVSWTHLLNTSQLAGPHGLRTVEPSYEHYMQQYRYDGAQRECQWNGPAWPFQTTQALLALANVLDHYNQHVINRDDYLRLLRQYTLLHYRGDVLNIEEDYDPATGKPIVGLARSPHYFHSGYIDIIMTGFVGIRPREDDILEINPLIPSSNDSEAIEWFRAEAIPYHGNQVAVEWDIDGSHFNQGPGLRVERDGILIGSSLLLERLLIPLPKKANTAIERPIAKSVQMQASIDFPHGNASSGTGLENVHEAIDGRVWFFPELPNGWTTDANSSADQWYTITFAEPTSVSRAEIAFFSDGVTFDVPARFEVQTQVNGTYTPIAAFDSDGPLANGITHAVWAVLTTDQVRLAFTQANDRRTRLVEFKLF